MNNPVSIGTIILYPVNKIPYGWLLCNGEKVTEEYLKEKFLNTSKKKREESLNELESHYLNPEGCLPKLQDCFVVGAGEGHTLHETKAADPHTHKFNSKREFKTDKSGNHKHHYPQGWKTGYFSKKTNSQEDEAVDLQSTLLENGTTESGKHFHTISVGNENAETLEATPNKNRPKRYALNYIMKVLK